MATLAMIFAAPEFARGQVFQLEGGTSTLYQVHGGSVGFRTSNTDGWVGLGSMDGFRYGAFMRTKLHGSTLTFGDDAIRFNLATDVFDSSHYFMGRGVGLAEVRGGTRIFGFVGASSRMLGTPYLRAAEADRGVGLLFLDRKITPTLSAFSRTVFSTRQTAINGLEWQPRSDVRASLAGGLGANQGYAATSFTLDREWITLRTAYIRAGDQFRRITVQQPLSSEVDRENVLLTLRPASFLTVTTGRQNFLQPFTTGSAGIRGSVNQFSTVFSAEQFYLSAALFDSQVTGLHSRGTSLSAGRDITSFVHVNANYLWNRAGNFPAMTSWLGTFREKISQRLSLLQLVNYSQGRTTASFGGNLVSNRISLGIEYQTLYLPFRTGNQFKQALVLSFQLHPFGNVHLNAGSYVAPDGTVKYTAYAGTFLYHGNLAAQPGSPNIDLYKHIVRGRVVDENGNPVRGAALKIDGDVVFSDSDGSFFSRKRRPAMFRMEVLLDQFIVAGKYEVVSAPSSVKAESDDVAQEVTIVLRHVRGAAR